MLIKLTLSVIFSKLISHPSWLDVQLLCLKIQTNPTSFYWITGICFGGYFLLGHSVHSLAVFRSTVELKPTTMHKQMCDSYLTDPFEELLHVKPVPEVYLWKFLLRYFLQLDDHSVAKPTAAKHWMSGVQWTNCFARMCSDSTRVQLQKMTSLSDSKRQSITQKYAFSALTL